MIYDLAAQIVLDGISINILKAIEDGCISIILNIKKLYKKKQSYLAIKNQIHTKVKKIIKNITQEAMRRNSKARSTRGSRRFF